MRFIGIEKLQNKATPQHKITLVFAMKMEKV